MGEGGGLYAQDRSWEWLVPYKHNILTQEWVGSSEGEIVVVVVVGMVG